MSHKTQVYFQSLEPLHYSQSRYGKKEGGRPGCASTDIPSVNRKQEGLVDIIECEQYSNWPGKFNSCQ